MKVLDKKPPIYDKAKAAFDFNEKRTIFTYGDTIYNPAGIPVSLDLHAHESVHERQQAAFNEGLFNKGPKGWWKKYIADPEFRFQQELEAYRAQYAYAKRTIKDRNKLNDYLVFIAGELKGPMYGNLKIGSLFDVMNLIKNTVQ